MNHVRLSILVLLLSTLAGRGGGPRALVFSPDKLPDAVVGQPYSALIAITQNVTPVGQLSVAPADLPPGLTLTFKQG
jgi:hypothetical protein